MQLKDMALSQHDDGNEVSATLEWEDRDRPATRLFFRTTDALSGDPGDYANAFLIAAAVPAMVFGETRIAIDQPVSPGLRRNLPVALAWLNRWFRFRRDALQLDVAICDSEQPRSQPETTASFFTGGIDSWATLALNRQYFRPHDPSYIRECIVVLGLQDGIDREQFRQAVDAFERVSDAMDVRIRAVTTNAYAHWIDLDPTYRLWLQSYNGASLAAVAHALPGRFSRALIGSTFSIHSPEPLVPWSTHACVDPYFSSSEIGVVHDGVEVNRLEKTRLMAEWPIAMANLRVCDEPNDNGYLNCGQCEKCVRTMLTLIALGRLQDCPAFPSRDMTQKFLLRNGLMEGPVRYADYSILEAPLAATGRHDLAEGVRILTRRRQQRDWKGLIKRADKLLTGGRVRTAIDERRRFRAGSESRVTRT